MVGWRQVEAVGIVERQRGRGLIEHSMASEMRS